jgi:hypothetical protein
LGGGAPPPYHQPKKIMSFDPTKPADHAPIVSAELRDQFNALQAQITALQQQLAFFTPVLTANNATMSLDWTYSGPAGDEFFIYVHQPNEAPGVFNDCAHVRGDLRTWATDFDDPADAIGYKYYIVPVDGADNPLTPPSNTVNFAAG